MDEYARAEATLATLDVTGRVSVNELVQRFSVSAVTVRKDLETLEQRGMLRRVRGGAVSVSTPDEGSFEMRLRQAREVKKAIAVRAAAIVDDGDVIALDASTTSYYLAQELLERRDLMVITNGMRTATLFMESSGATVLMPGGVLRRSAGSMVGPIGDVLAARGRIDKGFFGIKGLSITHGLMDLAIEEADAKKYLVAACSAVYGIFDSSKVGKFGLHTFAATKVLTGLFTDDQMPVTDLAAWERAGVDVYTVHRASGLEAAG